MKSRSSPSADTASTRRTLVARRDQSSPDQVAETLRDGVRTGRYVPGQRLVEADLTAELKLSRGPIREALKLLAAEGIIELHRHRGAYLRQLTRREVNDVLAIQELLTGLAARLAAEHIQEGDHRARFKQAYAALMNAYKARDGGGVLDARVRFYAELVALGGNAELARFVPIPQTNLLRAQFERHLPASERTKRRQDYPIIARLILAGKGAAAETAMRKHLRSTRQAINALPDAVFAKEVAVRV
ncbi:MAG TPA: GntR family transcriptional regulator [Gammaproteobacteria bacterium]|mgnify:CR=1 FL=1|nr:GntR family transcriptional regulator [Gammaproteobacteria bacterium]